MVGPHSFYEIMTRESSGKKNPSPTHSLSQYKTHFSELYDKVEKTWKEATKKQLLIKCEQEYENLCRIHEISLEERKDLVSAYRHHLFGHKFGLRVRFFQTSQAASHVGL